MKQTTTGLSRRADWMRAASWRNLCYFVSKLSLLMRPRNTLRPCDKSAPTYFKKCWKQVGRTTRQTFFCYYLMVENLQGHDSTGAVSPFSGKKAKTQIRCDRLIAARRGCFGKQDRLCLSDEKCSGGRQTWLADSEGKERGRAVQNETAKCWTAMWPFCK